MKISEAKYSRQILLKAVKYKVRLYMITTGRDVVLLKHYRRLVSTVSDSFGLLFIIGRYCIPVRFYLQSFMWLISPEQLRCLKYCLASLTPYHKTKADHWKTKLSVYLHFEHCKINGLSIMSANPLIPLLHIIIYSTLSACV